MTQSERLPQIIWVASRPPIPPFSGPTSKTLCGIDALASLTDIDLVTFTHRDLREEIQLKVQEYWKDRPVKLHLIEYGHRANEIHALLAGRYQFGTMVEVSALSAVLDELDWSNSNNLLILDDIVLAPLALEYGRNAILSPHDCISKMSYSHFRFSAPGLQKMKYYVQYRIARYYERTFYQHALLVHLVTQRDRILMEQINPNARYHVIPNAALLNPGFSKEKPDTWDILVWGDIRIGSIAEGVRKFLSLATQDRKKWVSLKTAVVGRVPLTEASRILGSDLLSDTEYVDYLEDLHGSVWQAKITVVPDGGGAGIKNRCVSVVSSGKCLACLYPMMDGIEKVCDRGAINANSLTELVVKVMRSLGEGTHQKIGEVGQIIFEQEYGLKSVERWWSELIQRAAAIRSFQRVE